jgi:hypothetical protein
MKLTLTKAIPALALCGFATLAAAEDIVVIVNPKNSNAALTTEQVEGIFLGKTTAAGCLLSKGGIEGRRAGQGGVVTHRIFGEGLAPENPGFFGGREEIRCLRSQRHRVHREVRRGLERESRSDPAVGTIGVASAALSVVQRSRTHLVPPPRRRARRSVAVNIKRPDLECRQLTQDLLQIKENGLP